MFIVNGVHNSLFGMLKVLVCELDVAEVFAKLVSLLTYLYLVRTNRVFVPAASNTSARDWITSDLVFEASKVCIDCSKTDRVIGEGASDAANDKSADDAAITIAATADFNFRCMVIF